MRFLGRGQNLSVTGRKLKKKGDYFFNNFFFTLRTGIILSEEGLMIFVVVFVQFPSQNGSYHSLVK